ncbi:MAG TPA: hypothetical protein VKY65_17950 [Alphaproteobacteria bacterium]|nr:hypothetical protein [Alphaproteobacteria bacterium]
MFVFGPGVLIGTRTDVASATPINFGKVQEVQLDIQFSKKELYGQNQFPLAIARGTAKLTGKAKMAQISGIAFNNLFFGMVMAPGQLATQYNEAATIPSASPYTYAVANAATYQGDLGVVYAATGLPLAKVAGGPAPGQYSVNAATGVYSFAAGDQGKSVLVTYTYNLAGAGQQLTLTNPLLGAAPSFQVNAYTSFQGTPLSIQLYNCMSDKLSIPVKLEDFLVPEIDFSAYANAAGNVMNMSFGEAS